MSAIYLKSWRLAAFGGGLFSLWVAVCSPLALLDHQRLTAHMVQHLLLMTVAAPLILLGAPAIKLRWGFGRVISNPIMCWLVATTTVIGWHVPSLFELAMQSQAWHTIEHANFFVAGILFWLPVIQPWPSVATRSRWSVPLYLFLATFPCDALSAFLTFCGRVVYPHYLHAHSPFDITALGDQEFAGALMWVWVTFAYLVPAAAVTIRMLSPRWVAERPEVV
jgi:cytochrome c oxidase assembly factor CtaG